MPQNDGPLLSLVGNRRPRAGSCMCNGHDSCLVVMQPTTQSSRTYLGLPRWVVIFLDGALGGLLVLLLYGASWWVVAIVLTAVTLVLVGVLFLSDRLRRGARPIRARAKGP